MAFDVYVLRLVQGIAAMTAALGGLDALVFTGGVGEHSHAVRAEACARMRWLGVEIDAEANESAVPDCDVSMPGISIPVLVIHTREELAIARECLRLITES
jgi:acetate kinase